MNDKTIEISNNKINDRLKVFYGVVALIIAWYFHVSKEDKISYSDLHNITDVITNKTELIDRPKKDPYIIIQLKSYPAFSFRIDGDALQATRVKRYLKQVNVGDTLNLDILIDDYQTKISKEKESGFWDGIFDDSEIDVYGLSDSNTTYLDVLDYNVERKGTHEGIVLFLGFMGFIVLGRGVYLLAFEKSAY